MFSGCKNLTLALLLACGQIASAVAHEGHDHGDAIALPQHYEPRFEARADTVELTGILKGGELWLFVAHQPDNTPWPGLNVALENGEKSGVAQALGPGIYRVAASELAQRGKHSVVVTLHGAGLDELLSGELVVPEASETAAPVKRWMLAGAAAGLAFVIAGGVLLRRRSTPDR